MFSFEYKTIRPENLDAFPDAESLAQHALDAVLAKAPRAYISYAVAKANAMHCRVKGDIQRAIQWEDCADGYYKRIPLRWIW